MTPKEIDKLFTGVVIGAIAVGVILIFCSPIFKPDIKCDQIVAIGEDSNSVSSYQYRYTTLIDGRVVNLKSEPFEKLGMDN